MDHWLNKRPFDRPKKAHPKKVGRVIVIGAGPAGLAAAQHLKVRFLAGQSYFQMLCSDVTQDDNQIQKVELKF